MNALIRVPHGFLRRHLSTVERVLAAAGMGLALYGLLTGLPAYPSPWEIVASAAVFLVMLWSPGAGYFLAVTAALYPLYTLSLYLAVLFLAVALLGQRVFIHNLGATLLVVLTPWLAQYHLEWITVLLGGLWWGKSGGAWMGGIAALWGQVLFGMTGQSPNWLDMMGIAPTLQGLFAQFKDANSLETLKLIVFPLGPNPTLLLYHLLQIALWAMVGGLIGGLSETNWVQQKHPWRAVAIAILGAGAIALANIGLANWLDQYKADDFAWIVPGLMESALYASVAAALLESTRDVIEHPLHRPLTGERESAAQAPVRVSFFQRMASRLSALRKPLAPASKAVEAVQAEAGGTIQGASSYQTVPAAQNLPNRDAKKQPPDDIIKIELD